MQTYSSRLRTSISNEEKKVVGSLQKERIKADSRSRQPRRGFHHFSQIPIFQSNTPDIQPKLKINTLGGQHEQEADKVAEQVVGASDVKAQKKCTACASCGQTCASCANKKKNNIDVGKLLFKANPGGAQAIGSPHSVMKSLGKGKALNGGIRSKMEGVFGMDFSDVKIHTDSQAASLSSRMNARAFAVGNHIAFSNGEFRPGTLVGDALLAHELAHVAQQKEAMTDASLSPINVTNASLEKEADQSAMAALSSLWGGFSNYVSTISKRAKPVMRSGLQISRCDPVATTGGVGPQHFPFKKITGLSDSTLPWYAVCVRFRFSNNINGGRAVQFEIGYPGIHFRGRTSVSTAQAVAAEAFNTCVPPLMTKNKGFVLPQEVATCVRTFMSTKIPGVRVNTPCVNLDPVNVNL